MSDPSPDPVDTALAARIARADAQALQSMISATTGQWTDEPLRRALAAARALLRLDS